MLTYSTHITRELYRIRKYRIIVRSVIVVLFHLRNSNTIYYVDILYDLQLILKYYDIAIGNRED